MVLAQPAVLVGRSPAWHGRQLVGVASPAWWKCPPAQEVQPEDAEAEAWQVAHSPKTCDAPWSKVIPAGSEALAEVSTPGRELAWQSRQVAGWEDSREAWKTGVPVPDGPVAQVADRVAEGLAWQAPQSAVTRRVAVGAPPDQATASCFISPEAGFRAGWLATGPTKPTGAASEWQSPQVAGWAAPRLARDEWNVPG